MTVGRRLAQIATRVEARRAPAGLVQTVSSAIFLDGQYGRARIEHLGQFAGELETYLGLNAGALVDDGRRCRAGLPISTSRAESVVNNLVNARMNKRRQMRWFP